MSTTTNVTFNSILGQIPPKNGDVVVGTDCSANGIWLLSGKIGDECVTFNCVRIDKTEKRELSFVGTRLNWKIIKRNNHTLCDKCK